MLFKLDRTTRSGFGAECVIDTGADDGCFSDPALSTEVACKPACIPAP
jgi:hypothetical protein